MRCFLPKALSLSTFKRESKNLCHSGNFVLSYYCSLHVLFGSVACRQNKDEVKIPWINGPIPVICHSSTKTCLLVTNKQTNDDRKQQYSFCERIISITLMIFFYYFFFIFFSRCCQDQGQISFYIKMSTAVQLELSITYKKGHHINYISKIVPLDFIQIWQKVVQHLMH